MRINRSGCNSFFLIFIFLLFFSCFQVTAQDRASLQITFIDVAGGNAALVETPGGMNILIDSGSEGAALMNYLREKRISRLDQVIITCPRKDNLMGLFDILKTSLDIGEFMFPSVDDTPIEYENVLEQIMVKQDAMVSGGDRELRIEDALNNRLHYEFRNLESGTVLSWGADVSAVVLGPYRFYQGTKNDLNNNSLVIKVTYGRHSFLFTGNMEQNAQKDITRLGSKIQATVLQIPDHGISTISASFLQKVAPQFSVFQPRDSRETGSLDSTIATETGVKVYTTQPGRRVVIQTDGVNIKVNSTGGP